MSGISETINEFFNFDIFDEDNNELYCCNDIVIYKNELYKSLVNNNNRNPHDADAWFYIGTLADIINYIIADDKGYKLDIPYYPESTNSCHSMFSKGQCVVDKVPKTDALGIPIKDDCGNVTYDYLIFNSLIDCNTTPPLLGSQANPPTWTQGRSVCEYLAGSVGWTQNGDTENYQVSSSNPQCLLDCSAPDDETIALATQGTEGTHSQTIGNKLRVRHDTNTLSTTPANGLEVNLGKGLTADANGISIKLGDSSIIVDDDGIKVGEIGKDPAGNPINADTCLVTCDGLGNGLTLSGNKVVLKPADSSIIVDANGVKVDVGDGVVLTANGVSVKPADSSIIVDANGIKVGEIGKDPAGNPINADTCLVTCDGLGNGLTIAGGKVVIKAADNSVTIDQNGIRANLIPDSDVTIGDTNTSRGSPVKVDQQGLNAEGDPHYVADYDTTSTPITTAATPKPWRLVIEAADGKEYVLRSGKGYREHHDGRAEMWGTVLLPVGSEDKAVEVTLPVPLNGPITYSNSHVSVTDVGWAAADGQDLDDLPDSGIGDPSVDAFNNTDVGWGPSTTDPVGKFVIWPYQHESNGSAAIELVSWHLVTERGLA